MVDELPPGTPRYTGPRCPSCQSPTTSCCPRYSVGCPWLVCAQGRHLIRIRDAHVQGERGEYRPSALTDPVNDGARDPRGKDYWDAIYPEIGRPAPTIGPSPWS